MYIGRFFTPDSGPYRSAPGANYSEGCLRLGKLHPFNIEPEDFQGKSPFPVAHFQVPCYTLNELLKLGLSLSWRIEMVVICCDRISSMATKEGVGVGERMSSSSSLLPVNRNSVCIIWVRRKIYMVPTPKSLGFLQ